MIRQTYAWQYKYPDPSWGFYWAFFYYRTPGNKAVLKYEFTSKALAVRGYSQMRTDPRAVPILVGIPAGLWHVRLACLEYSDDFISRVFPIIPASLTDSEGGSP